MTTHAGMSQCPICRRRWLVVPTDDCFMPACGCFGDDAGPENPARPCEACGLKHVLACEKPRT